MTATRFSLANYICEMGKDFSCFAKYQWKRHKKLMILIGVTAVFFVGMLAWCDYNDATGITKVIIGWMDMIFGSDDISEYSDILNISVGTNSISAGGVTLGSTLIGMINKIHSVFQTVGNSLVIIFFGVGILEEISFNQMFAEKLIKKFIFLFIAIALVNSSKDLVYGIANIGSDVTTKVVATVNSSETATDDIKNEIYEDLQPEENGGTLKKILSQVALIPVMLGYLVELLIPFIIGQICHVIITVVCWSRFLEITLMAVVSPIMVADVSRGNGMQSGAIKGIKNVFAISLSGAIILISLYLGTEIAANAISDEVTLENVASQAWNIIAINIVKTGMVMRASTLAKQAMGMA